MRAYQVYKSSPERVQQACLASIASPPLRPIAATALRKKCHSTIDVQTFCCSSH